MGADEAKRVSVVQARDGVALHYESVGKGDRVLLLANGLGGRLYSWQPLIEECAKDHRIITWDYRGIFESSTPQELSRLSIRDQAEDGLEILAKEGVKQAVLVGWSMGVQVSLEAAALRPEAVSGLVLLNGTWGHLFSSALQPARQFAFLRPRMHQLLEWMQRHGEIADLLAMTTKATSLAILALYFPLLGRRTLALRPLLERYTSDIYRPGHFENYLRLFQELDAHSAYHHLPHIKAPTLVVSGRYDILSPAYCSRVMAQRLPNVTHLHVKNGSHFLLVERPESILPTIRTFLDGLPH